MLHHKTETPVEYPLYPVKGLRPSSLRKSSYSNSSSSCSSINNSSSACPPPPPTPHQIQTNASTSQHQQRHQQQQQQQQQHQQQQHPQYRRNSSSLAAKPAINLLSNRQQFNYFEFPSPTRSGSSLLANRYTAAVSTPALRLQSRHELQQPQPQQLQQQQQLQNSSSYSSAVAKAAASTACALLATCHVASNSSTAPAPAPAPAPTPTTCQPETTNRESMGRREIKRSNTSGSTSRSYDSGSATTNFVGKFTQSVRRIVQDVKDEGAPSGMTRDEVIETNERLRSLRLRLEESYDTVKKALINLMNQYGDSKSHRNIFQRYPKLKLMIKEVIRLETQYWTLVDIPRQEKQETVPSYVMRACSIMEKTQKSGEGVKTSARLAEEAAERRERMERLEHMTTAQIELENTQLINDLYRLLKKYLGLRHLIRVLKEEYGSSKMYPIFPRYTMLKDMIKGIMHDPDYMEVCHETLANSN
ncbi:LOW QUALITY PROTEIN: uncharacterized protein Dmoj_GI21986 [Drosophila mojavensis]|uniref:Uncharacterized protein n=3 Tax=Drosophila mojavensis TaxID=7230 RepID=B4KBF3_DROMO|nr:LOW QUALITY PROTEIN: uncharacterized protein Dmoj_GI21986 [Drosophila mojavensis]